MFPLKYITFLTFAGGVFADVASSFKQANIVPNPIKTAPQYLLGIEYPNEVIVLPGDNLTSSQVVASPKNYYVADADSYYNLVLLDIDAPYSGKQIYVWGVGNIRGMDVSSGHELAPYLSPKTPSGSPSHRLVMLVYQQPGYIQYDQADIAYANGRIFDIDEFGKKHKFTGPLLGNFYYLLPESTKN